MNWGSWLLWGFIATVVLELPALHTRVAKE